MEKDGRGWPAPFVPVDRGDRRFAFGPGKWAARGEKVDGTRYGSVPARRIRFGIVAESGPVQPLPSWMAGLMDTKVEQDDTGSGSHAPGTPADFVHEIPEDLDGTAPGAGISPPPSRVGVHGPVGSVGRATPDDDDDELVLGAFEVIEGGAHPPRSDAPPADYASRSGHPTTTSEDAAMDQDRQDMMEHRLHGVEKSLEALGDDVRLLQDSWMRSVIPAPPRSSGR